MSENREVISREVSGNMSKEEFKGLCLEVIPVINKIKEYLENLGISEIASLTMSADGYIDFCVHGNDWRLSRISGDEAARMENHCVEVLKI